MCAKLFEYPFSDALSELSKTIDKMARFTSLPAVTDSLQAALNASAHNSVFTAVEAARSLYDSWPVLPSAVDMLSDVAAALELNTPAISSLAQSVLPQIDLSLSSILAQTAAELVQLPQMDWSWVSDVYAEEDDDDEPWEEDTSTIVTPEIRAAMAEDITRLFAKPAELEQASKSKYLEWKARHPMLADLYLSLFLPILCSIIVSLGSMLGGTLNKDAKVYSEPTSASNVVVNLTVEQNVTIVGSVPYYYEVEFTDPETGEQFTGYIYKPNVSVDNNSETEVPETRPGGDQESPAEEAPTETIEAEATEAPNS